MSDGDVSTAGARSVAVERLYLDVWAEIVDCRLLILRSTTASEFGEVSMFVLYTANVLAFFDLPIS